MRVVDARGLACPKPVLMTKDALESAGAGDAFRVLVDNAAAKENVLRFVRSRGAEGRVVEEKDKLIVIEVSVGKKPSTAGEFRVVCERPQEAKKVVFVGCDRVGRGDDELGAVLMKAALAALAEVQPRPQTIVFMNSGVKLAVEGSPVLDDLRRLQDLGIEILVCGTCLDWFGLKEEVRVGRVSNMFSILEQFLNADSVVGL